MGRELIHQQPNPQPPKMPPKNPRRASRRGGVVLSRTDVSTLHDDIVKDILQRVLDAAARNGGVDDRLANQIEREVKRDWGGTTPYIQHGIDKQRAERNEKSMLSIGTTASATYLPCRVGSGFR